MRDNKVFRIYVNGEFKMANQSEFAMGCNYINYQKQYGKENVTYNISKDKLTQEELNIVLGKEGNNE